jgi:hypothetical protein
MGRSTHYSKLIIAWIRMTWTKYFIHSTISQSQDFPHRPQSIALNLSNCMISLSQDVPHPPQSIALNPSNCMISLSQDVPHPPQSIALNPSNYTKERGKLVKVSIHHDMFANK